MWMLAQNPGHVFLWDVVEDVQKPLGFQLEKYLTSKKSNPMWLTESRPHDITYPMYVMGSEKRDRDGAKFIPSVDEIESGENVKLFFATIPPRGCFVCDEGLCNAVFVHENRTGHQVVCFKCAEGMVGQKCLVCGEMIVLVLKNDIFKSCEARVAEKK